MGTKAAIGIVTKNGKVKCVGVQFDGYVNGVGTKLLENYTDERSISKLMERGYIWSLGESVETTKYGLDVDGWMNGDKPEIAYTTKDGFFGEELYTECDIDSLYQYLYKDGEWWVKKFDDIRKLKDAIGVAEFNKCI